MVMSQFDMTSLNRTADFPQNLCTRIVRERRVRSGYVARQIDGWID